MKTSFWLFVAIVVIFSLGVVMVFSTTSAEVIDKAAESVSYLSMYKQLAFCVFGSIIGYCIYLIGYEWWIKQAHILFGFSLILLLLVFVPVIGMQINGARRWINFFGISLQPSEFVKIVIPLYYIQWFSAYKQGLTFKKFCQWQPLFMAPIFLIIMEPDNGTAAILLATIVVLYFLTAVKWTYWAIPIVIVSCLGVTLALSMKHVSDRIYIYLHPEADLLGKGHQPYQAKIAAGSGGVLGKGFGESLQKYNYLPEARSDYISAIYAEELGFLGMLVLIILYMIIAVLGFCIGVKAKDQEGYYLATILTFMITFQAFLNLGVVSGLLPSKGTNLPFFSQGGSSLLANIFMVAMLMNIQATGRGAVSKPLS